MHSTIPAVLFFILALLTGVYGADVRGPRCGAGIRSRRSRL